MVANIDPFTGQMVDAFGVPIPGQPGDPAGLGAHVQPAPQVTPQAPLQPSPPPPADPSVVPAPTVPQQPAPGSGYGQRSVDPRIAAGLSSDQDKTLLPGERRAASEVGAMAGRQMDRISGAAADVEATGLAAAEVEADAMEAKSRALESRLRMERGIESADRAAHEISVAEVRAARGRMEQQLAANRAMSVDPTLNFTAGESLGNAASLFAQGFLQAGYGIKIDVAGTLDGWTDRYVSNQMEKIRKGERLAEQDRVVWEMVRTEAADEQDARDRYKAFAMSQAATAMEIEASRWGSELYRAKGAEQAASARMAVAQHMNGLETRHYELLQGAKAQEFTKWAKRWELSISQQNANTARDAATAKQAPARADYLYDVSPSGGGKIAGQFNEYVSPEKKFELQSRVGAVSALNTKVKELIELQASVGPVYDGIGGKVFRDEDQQRVESLRKDIRAAYSLLQSGKATNETEQRAFDEVIPADTLLTHGGRTRILADFIRHSVDRLNTEVRGSVLAPGGDRSKAPDLGLSSGEWEWSKIVSDAPEATRTFEEKQFDAASRPGGHDDAAEPATDWDRKHGVPITDGKVPDWSTNMQSLHLSAEGGHEASFRSLEKMAGDFSNPKRADVASSILDELRAGRAKSQLRPALMNQDGTVAVYEDGEGNQYRVGPDGTVSR